jgi:hypothetical protein
MVKYLKLNILYKKFLLLKHRIKHFASVIILAQVSSLPKVRDETLQSFDAPSLLIFFQPVHKYYVLNCGAGQNIFICHAECRHVKFHYADCHHILCFYTKSSYVEWSNIECHYDQCRGPLFKDTIQFNSIYSVIPNAFTTIIFECLQYSNTRVSWW